MKELKILYVHGYLGHGNGSASRYIRAELDKRGVTYTLDAPEFPVTDPDETIMISGDGVNVI